MGDEVVAEREQRISVAPSLRRVKSSARRLLAGGRLGYSAGVKLLLENLPPSLAPQREVLRRCLEAMDAALPLRQVILFGSHARGEARSDSDVDLCLVADGAERQLEAARQFREAIWHVWPRPSLTLVPITPARLREKDSVGDYFFGTVRKEGVLLASEN